MVQFLCGAAKADITPKEEWLPWVPGFMGEAYGGVIHPVHVRVIAVKKGEQLILLLGYEMLILFTAEQLTESLRRQFDIPEENIMIFCTHNHLSPVVKPTNSTDKTGEYSRIYLEFLEKQTLNAAKEAISKLCPAKMGIGFGKSYINVNRNKDYRIRNDDGTTKIQTFIGMNYEGITDKTLSLIRFEDMDGRPIAFFMNHPTHATVCAQTEKFGGKQGICSDFPGFVCTLMEEKFKGSVALWSSGAAGDQNPIWTGCWFGPDERSGAATVRSNGPDSTEMTKNLAAIHYDDIINLNRDIVCREDVYVLAAKKSASITPGRKITYEDPGDFMSPVLSVEPEGGIYQIPMQLIRIGDVSLIGIGGELYASLGLYLKENVQCPNPVVVTHTGAHTVGYILDDDGIARGCHGYRQSAIRPGYVKESLLKTVNLMADHCQ
ncbi:MAG: hypothetical protein KHX56_03015 [Clostridiales bacterium]|nr:hypothetical protein [Clostridiales bacterium]